MKILGIVCSARKESNTELLIQEAMAAAKEAGADDLEVLYLGDKTISPCRGCETCIETGKCAIDDDMQEIYPKLLSADGIIIGTPVYFWGACGLAKNFIDRTYCLIVSHLAIMPELRAKMKSRGEDLRNKAGGIIVVTARVGGTTALRQVSDFFRVHRMIEAGSAIALARNKGGVNKDEQGLNEARWTGRAVVRTIKQRQALGR